MANLDMRATAPRPIEAGDEWLVTVPLDDSICRLLRPAGWAEHGRLLGFFHGLLFDRALLESSAGVSPDLSDADLILRAYALGQERELKRLRGKFVLAVIDRQSGKAVVMRDAFGTHPLFYAQSGSKLLFAGSPQSLIEQAGLPRKLNRAALADHICQRWPDRQETYFCNIHRVPAGWWATVADNKLELARWWHPAPDGFQWLDRDGVSRFDELLERAVARCLDHGRTGIFLSGGFDSVSIAAIASDQARTGGGMPPLALSLGFPHADCDERLVQTGIARRLGLPQHLIDLNEAIGFRPLLTEAVQANEWLPAPLSSPWLPAYRSLMQFAKNQGVQIILTGEGGDEWLTVSPVLAADLIRSGEWLAAIQLFNSIRRSQQMPMLAVARNVLWKCGIRMVAGSVCEAIMPGALRDNRIRRMLAHDAPWVAPDPQLRAEQRDRAPLALPPEAKHGFYLRDAALGLDHALTSWASEEQDAVGRKTGIQLLHPYFDPDLVELLYRTPPRLLSEGGRAKSLVRRVLARRFPSLGFERQKKVSALWYYHSMMLSQGAALLEICGDFPALSDLGVVDGCAARDFWRDMLQKGDQRVREMWGLINLEMWTRSQLH